MFNLGTLSPDPGSTELAEVWDLSLWANSMAETEDDTVRTRGLYAFGLTGHVPGGTAQLV
jgi:hypothetical protein